MNLAAPDSIFPPRKPQQLRHHGKGALLCPGDRMHVEISSGRVTLLRGQSPIRIREVSGAEKDAFEFSSVPNTIVATQLAEFVATLFHLGLTRISRSSNDILFEFL